MCFMRRSKEIIYNEIRFIYENNYIYNSSKGLNCILISLNTKV